MWPFHEPVLAWLVYLPNASYELKKADGKAETLRCPLHVSISASTGQFLVAYGDSAPQWVKGWESSAGEHPTSFGATDEKPRLNVREVLERYRYRSSPYGQVFVRFVMVTTPYPKEVIRQVEGEEEGPSVFQPFPGWVFSLRGSLRKGGFSTPRGYTGPPLYNTCCNFILSDATGKDVLGESY